MSTSLRTDVEPVKRKIPHSAWKKGVSGNPAGRPKTIQEIKDAARAHSTLAIDALVRWLKDRKRDPVPAAALLLAYAYGRPEIRAQVRMIHSINDLSEEELRAIVERGDPDALDSAPAIDGEAEELEA